VSGLSALIAAERRLGRTEAHAEVLSEALRRLDAGDVSLHAFASWLADVAVENVASSVRSPHAGHA
jgi:hypothetical protein